MTAGRFLLDQIGTAWFATALQHYAAAGPGRLRGRRTRPTGAGHQRHPQRRPTACRRAGADGQGRARQCRRPRRRTTAGRHPHQPRPTRQHHRPARPRRRENGAAAEQSADRKAPAAGATRGGPGAAGLARCEQTGPLSALALGVLSCDAILERCTVGPFGQILDYGRARRLATPAQRRALAARDGGCLIPGCGALPTGAMRITASRGSKAAAPTCRICCCSAPATTPRCTPAAGSSRTATGCRGSSHPIWLDPQQRPIRNRLPDTINRAQRLAQQLRLDHEDTG